MKPNSYPGKFIVFEGIEGSGKTTQAGLLAEKLGAEGFKVLLTKEPTDGLFFGKLARAIYTSESAEEALRKELVPLFKKEEYRRMKSSAPPAKLKYLRYLEDSAKEILKQKKSDVSAPLQIAITLDRHEHLLKIIIPALKRGVRVISDRYFASTPAYAAANGSGWRPFLKMQSDILGQDFLAPDLMIFLSVSVDEGLARTAAKQNGKKEYFDDSLRLNNIKLAYEKIIALPEIKKNIKTAVFDGGLEPDDLHTKILEETKKINLGPI